MFRKLSNKWHSLLITVKVSTTYAFYSVLQRGLPIITMPLFTRLLTTEQYGQAVLYSSWGSLFAIAITLNLACGSFSVAMMKFEDRRNEYIPSLEEIFLLLGMLFIVIYVPLKLFWKYNFGFNIPLVPYYLSQMTFNQSDRIIISHYTCISNAVLYGVVYGLGMVLPFVSSEIKDSYISIEFRVTDNPETEYEAICEGLGDKIMGLKIVYSKDLMIKNLHLEKNAGTIVSGQVVKNESLISQKEGFGGRTVAYQTWEMGA